jgi:hypothetical protein
VSPRIRSDLRFVVGVRLPRDLLASAEEEARRSGRPVADVLGDLAAQRLPEALAEAARDQLAQDAAAARRIVQQRKSTARLATGSTNGSAPAINRGTPNDCFQASSIGSIPARRLNKGTSSDAVAS